MSKGKFLVLMDKHRTRLALLLALPIVILMFWMMYSAGVKHDQKKLREDRKGEARVVAPAEPLEMKTKTNPDITVILGLKKPVPQKRQEESMIVQNQDAQQGQNQPGGREPKREPDPYPDAR